MVKADDFGNLAVQKSNRLTQVKSDGRQARSTLARTQRKTAEILKNYGVAELEYEEEE
ncbi:hypothetical protein QUA90_30255 [Microcoleus sp. D3_18_C4]